MLHQFPLRAIRITGDISVKSESTDVHVQICMSVPTNVKYVIFVTVKANRILESF